MTTETEAAYARGGPHKPLLSGPAGEHRRLQLFNRLADLRRNIERCAAATPQPLGIRAPAQECLHELRASQFRRLV